MLGISLGKRIKKRAADDEGNVKEDVFQHCVVKTEGVKLASMLAEEKTGGNDAKLHENGEKACVKYPCCTAGTSVLKDMFHGMYLFLSFFTIIIPLPGCAVHKEWQEGRPHIAFSVKYWIKSGVLTAKSSCSWPKKHGKIEYGIWKIQERGQ